MAPSVAAERNPAMMSNGGRSAVVAIPIGIRHTGCSGDVLKERESKKIVVRFMLEMSLKMSYVIATAVPPPDTAT